MTLPIRIRAALRAAGVHLLISVVVALLAAVLVFAVWYPFPYRELAGGRELFLLIVVVDVVCGPLLTLVLFNPTKPRAELWRDLGLVALNQKAALGNGLWTVWQARPLYLVLEIDRFKVITAPDFPAEVLKDLPLELQPRWLGAPVVVGLRPPKDSDEKNTVMFEAIQTGRDYAERPEFYVPYEGAAALKRAKPLATFLQKHPSQAKAAQDQATAKNADLSQWLYLPVMGRHDWVALLDAQGRVQGFLPGDGF